MAAQRAADQVKPDDSASGVGSWMRIPEERGEEHTDWGANPPPSTTAAPGPAQASTAWDADSEEDVPRGGRFFAAAQAEAQAQGGQAFQQAGSPTGCQKPARQPDPKVL